ncbi:HepT-like ribonuclease domain-containing protein [Pararhizobium sp.]|uniref:HepT-like ribonuclease domain-containing protein n=1 Tax=Pararhizobium sp. TaxID=1977563 RepID=UPI00272306A9|nr:HepT-like ribonuclease domain-containing protein [Pararhizobium sp.]MDO9415729.1 DUF86 domain-containing protein [Pararhizobium sp.]
MLNGIASLPSKRPKTRLRDIVENINLISTYTNGYHFELFARSQLVHDAVERCLSRISEAASKLGAMAESLLPQHDWKGIRDLGNILRHEYDNVDDRAIWSIIATKLVPLLDDVNKVIPQLPDDK